MKKIQLVTGQINSIDADLLVLPVSLPPDQSPDGKSSVSKRKAKSNKSIAAGSKNIWSRFDAPSRQLLRKLDGPLDGAIENAIRQQEFKPDPGTRLDIAIPQKRGKNGQRFLRLSGIESQLKQKVDDRAEGWRRIAGDAVSAAQRLHTKRIALWVEPRPDEIASVLTAIAEGVQLGSYSFDRYKSKKRKKSDSATITSFSIVGPRSVSRRAEALRLGEVAAQATTLTRDLVNTAPSDLLPRDLVKTARQVASGRGSGIRVRAYGKQALRKMGAGGILAVSRGSSSEPFLIHLSYVPAGRARYRKRVVMIGKGVTFDSGGLSIKPAKGMEDMKCDMAGAAAVIAVMQAISNLPRGTLKHEVHAIVPTTENMVNADSIKPGDIYFALNGKSVEVLNTDAEGRLILADALSYSADLSPDLIIDLATLTGACIVALGSDYAGIFSNNAALEESIKRCAKDAGELLWPLPLAKEYRAQLDSPVANLRNIGSGGPGATVAALFLQEFVPENTPWVHLDIAGPAYVEKANEYTQRGGTGYGVRTLIRFLLKLDELKL